MNKDFFDKFLVLDVQTSGINRESQNPADGYQVVSVGLLVSSMKDLKIIDKFYAEIKPTQLNWDTYAQKIHGFSKEYLEKNGISEEECADQIGLFIDKHLDVGSPIPLAGLNPQFSKQFLFQMLDRYGLPLNFHYSMIDVKTLGIVLFNAYTMESMFNNLGFTKKSNFCNALENAEFALKALKMTTKLWDKILDG